MWTRRGKVSMKITDRVVMLMAFLALRYADDSEAGRKLVRHARLAIEKRYFPDGVGRPTIWQDEESGAWCYVCCGSIGRGYGSAAEAALAATCSLSPG